MTQLRMRTTDRHDASASRCGVCIEGRHPNAHRLNRPASNVVPLASHTCLEGFPRVWRSSQGKLGQCSRTCSSQAEESETGLSVAARRAGLHGPSSDTSMLKIQGPTRDWAKTASDASHRAFARLASVFVQFRDCLRTIASRVALDACACPEPQTRSHIRLGCVALHRGGWGRLRRMSATSLRSCSISPSLNSGIGQPHPPLFSKRLPRSSPCRVPHKLGLDRHPEQTPCRESDLLRHLRVRHSECRAPTSMYILKSALTP